MSLILVSYSQIVGRYDAKTNFERAKSSFLCLIDDESMERSEHLNFF
jgi:hypothetical protein